MEVAEEAWFASIRCRRRCAQQYDDTFVSVNDKPPAAASEAEVAISVVVVDVKEKNEVQRYLPELSSRALPVRFGV